jgi:hypothetical protein
LLLILLLQLFKIDLVRPLLGGCLLLLLLLGCILAAAGLLPLD